MRALVFVLFLAGCGSMPVTVMPLINCPQPSADALAPAVALPIAPMLSSDPSETIHVLSDIIATDTSVYVGEVSKRQALIDFGVKECKWMR